MNSTNRKEIEVLVDLKPLTDSMCQQNSVIRVPQHLSPSQFAAKIVSAFDAAISDALPNGCGFISISKCHTKFDRFVTIKSTDQDFLEDGDKFEVDLSSDNPNPKDLIYFFSFDLKAEAACVLKSTEDRGEFESRLLSVPSGKVELSSTCYKEGELRVKEESGSVKPGFTTVQPSGLYQPAVEHQQHQQHQKSNRFDLSTMGSRKRRDKDRMLKRDVSLPSLNKFSKSERGIVKKCHNCGGRGHIAIQCPSERESCFNCGQKGHFSRECPRPVKCHKCHTVGHFAIHCPGSDKCYNCNETGHLRAQCSRLEKRCFNCQETDHLSRECPHPVMCGICAATDHISKSCPEHLVKRDQEQK